MNRIELNFVECSPAPPQGYVIVWRVKGSLDAFTNAGTFYSSPAVFFDNTHIAGTAYEGFIQSQFPGLTCDQIPWESGGSGASSGSGGCGSTIEWNYQNNSPQPARFRIFVNGVIVVNVTTTQTGSVSFLPGDLIDYMITSAAPGSSELVTIGNYNNTTTGADSFQTDECGLYFIYGTFNPL